MKVLVDTNVLARSAQPAHPQQKLADDAVAMLRNQGHVLCLVPQVLYEFWVVCTRPAAVNGLGKTAPEASTELAALKSLFPILDDTPAVFSAWEQLVTALPVLGKGAHDARLVAAMMSHGVSHLLTFNDQDFHRFTGITVLTPTFVLAPPTSP